MTLDILIADDHVLFRQGVAALLRAQPGWRIVGEAGTGKEAVELAHRLKPQVVILDVEMPELDGIEAARQISGALPQTRIVALSMYANAHYRQRMQDAAAMAYVSKNQPIDELIAAINLAVGGDTSSVRKPSRTRNTGAKASAVLALNTLSNRERTVLRLLAEGQRMADVATAMGISVKTVETYRARLQHKLEIHELSDLVRFAIRAGLVSPEK